MPRVTCVFSTLGVQNVILNGFLERGRDHVKTAERMERPQKADEYLKFSAQYGCRDELMYSRCEMLYLSETWYKAVAIASAHIITTRKLEFIVFGHQPQRFSSFDGVTSNYVK